MTEGFAAVVLAGGGLDAELSGVVAVPAKALIPIGGVPMLQRVVEALQAAPSVGAVTVVMEPSLLPASLAARVPRQAPAGASMLDSLASGLQTVPPEEARRGVLVVPADCPFLSPAAIEDFLAQVRSRRADLHYGYLSRDDSEREYPGFRHTYAPLREGRMCGTGLIVLVPEVVAAARRLMEQAVAARKSPLQIAGLLGVGFIVKLLFRTLTVQEAETRVGQLLGRPVAAIRTRHACAGINVDSPDQWRAAVRLAGYNPGASSGG